VARIARADDTDNSVPFDDLAELTSALNRRSDFHVLSPFFHKIAKHAAVSPSPDPAGLTTAVLHGSVASIYMRRSLRFLLDPWVMRCGGMEFTTKPSGILIVI
jgi:hypothetical protein